MKIQKWCIIPVLVAALFSALVVPALADRTGTKLPDPTMINGTLANEQELISALVAPDSIQYVDNLTFEGISEQVAVFTSSLQGFPVEGSQYVAVSTGVAAVTAGQATDYASWNVGGVEIPGGSPDGYNAYDVATLTLRLDLTGVSASDKPELTFYFKFMSEEVPEYLWSSFQDFFTVKAYNANGTLVENIARLPNGDPFTIDNAWPLMNQVGGSSFSPLPPYPDPNDVSFNGCTDTRTVVFDLSGLAGQVVTLEFRIGDVSDGIYDSAVFLDGLGVDLEGGGVTKDRVDLGVLMVYGDNVLELSSTKFRLEGNVHIDDVMRFDGMLEVDTLTKTITGNCRVWFEDPDESAQFTMPEIDISDVAVQFFIDASQDPAVFRFTSQISELGFEVAGVKVLARQLELYFNDPQHGYGFKADIYLAVGNIEGDPNDSGPGGSLGVDGFYATSKEGIWFDQAKLIVRNAKVGGGFGIDYMELTYEPGTPDRFAVDNITISIKHWDTTIWGNLELIGGQVNAIGLGFEHGTGIMIIPLPSPPSAIYLQSLEAGIEGLVTGDIIATGGIGFTYMPEITVGDYTCHVVRCDVTGLIEEGHFNVSGTVSFLYDGWSSAGISVDWWAVEGVEINGYVSLGNIITGTLYAKIDDHFRCRSSVEIDLPWYVPFIGWMDPATIQLAWVDWTLGFKIEDEWLEHSVIFTPDPDCPYTVDCGFLSCVDVPFTPVTICVNCGFDELLSDTYTAVEALGSLSTVAGLGESFVVAVGQASVIARVEGDSGSIPYLELVDPLGNVITPALALANPELYIYRENIEIGEAYIAVRNPMAGQWQLQVPGTLENKEMAAKGFSTQVLSAAPPPTIEVTGPDVPTTTSDQVQITWQGTSSFVDTDVSLFFSETEGEAGVLIADQQSVSGSYTWDVRGTPPGTYWIYATINDGQNAEVSDFGPATVTIEKDDPTAVLDGPATGSVGVDVVLDASASSDSWGSDLTVEWSFLSKPEGSAAGLVVQEDPDHARFVPDLAGTYQVEVVVKDAFGGQDAAQITVEASASPAALTVPQEGTISFVGNEFTVVATVTDDAVSPLADAMVHLKVVDGPNKGFDVAVGTNSAGKAAPSYTGQGAGTDTIQIWAGANTYDEASESLRTEIGHVWVDVDPGEPTPAVFRVTQDGDMSADGSLRSAGTLESGFADVAEWVLISEPVTAGDVLELDPDNPGQYRISQTACSPYVAGVVSTEPGFTLGNALASYEDKAILALVGMVPVKVTDEGGPILAGDLLVSSSTPGHAMRWVGQEACPCALIGKALESMQEDEGIILVLLTAH